MRLTQTFSTATLAAALLAGVALAPFAGLAQTTTQQPAQQTGQTATTEMAQQPTHATQDGFLVRQEADQMLVSNLMGVDVVGAAGENIGNVDDVVADLDGRILGIVVGVGGFLGMGQKDVGIPVDALSFDIEGVADGTRDEGLAGQGTWGWGTGRVNRVIVEYTEAQLEAAPEFRRFDE
jgi:sporulation protein YlmC with PRC-barrel domain